MGLGPPLIISLEIRSMISANGMKGYNLSFPPTRLSFLTWDGLTGLQESSSLNLELSNLFGLYQFLKR
jgi:hypothetical protein